MTDRALELHRKLTKTVPDPAGTGRVKRGIWTYDPDLETRRIAYGQTLIRRVAPGPREDPGYLAFLAHQAASIELAYELLGSDCKRFLLGTAHNPEVNAFSERLEVGDYNIVVLNSGLVDFVYQCAKVVVEAVRPERNTVPGVKATLHVSWNFDTIRNRLVNHPAAVDRLYHTLEAYFFGGYPRATANETVPEEQLPVLGLTIGMAERWIIGHEYGHGHWTPAKPPEGVNPIGSEEYFADSQATIMTVLSAAHLDAVEPDLTLGSALFALACLDVHRRALYLLTTGDEHWVDPEHGTHPAPSDRSNQVISCFRKYFNVEYHEDHTFALDYVPERDGPYTHAFTDERARSTYKEARVLEIVWNITKDRFVQDLKQKRPLHPMWQ
ncbi:hypothetical protein ACX80V_07925 [Arthrobacter sp. MDT3-24]